MDEFGLRAIIGPIPHSLAGVGVASFKTGAPEPLFLLSDGSDDVLEKRRVVFSVTKSILSLLYGIAWGEGLVPDPTGDACVRFGDQDVRIRDLFLMTSGRGPDPSDGTLPLMCIEDSWEQYCLREPRDPTRGFCYSSSNSQLIAAMLTRSVGMPLQEYAEQKLFGPLGLGPVRQDRTLFSEIDFLSSYYEIVWGQDAEGVNGGWSFLCLSLRDMMEIGKLALNRGRAGTQQLVPAEWFDMAWRTSVFAAGKVYESGAWRFGLHWWVSEKDGVHRRAARGYAGQRILVLPQLGAVVVCISNATRESGDAANLAADRVLDEIVGVLLDEAQIRKSITVPSKMG